MKFNIFTCIDSKETSGNVSLGPFTKYESKDEINVDTTVYDFGGPVPMVNTTTTTTTRQVPVGMEMMNFPWKALVNRFQAEDGSFLKVATLNAPYVRIDVASINSHQPYWGGVKTCSESLSSRTQGGHP
ncbi:hypothetical protein [Undibacterium sp. SXout20W]|uniref:hypothetical protein n=1 Tax=Undibacterium sp. SXout20W TaxID=3413051 RepID=UPI003BF2DF8F